MSEGGRLIAFDDEVSEPGKAVANHRPQQREPGMSERESNNQDSESENGAAAVQNPIAGMAMRAQIKREKLVVVGKLSVAHNDSL